MLEKNKKILLSVFIVFGILVAPHEGEFWPFSIFPMFSQAGNEWTRAHVRLIDQDAESITWEAQALENLDGVVLAMDSVDVNTNDVSNFVSKTRVWDDTALENLRNLIGNITTEQHVLVYRVRGRLDGDNRDAVVIDFLPYILFTPEGTITHPNIEELAR